MRGGEGRERAVRGGGEREEVSLCYKASLSVVGMPSRVALQPEKFEQAE